MGLQVHTYNPSHLDTTVVLFNTFTYAGGVQGERALQMDVQEGSRLQLQAFEAINEVVRSASSDTLPLVGQLIQALLDKLASTFRMQITSTEAREHQNDLQVQPHRFRISIMQGAYTCLLCPHICTAVTQQHQAR